MVVRGTLCLEGCDDGDGNSFSWRAEQVWLDRTLTAMLSSLSSVQWEQEAALVWGAGVEKEGL